MNESGIVIKYCPKCGRQHKLDVRNIFADFDITCPCGFVLRTNDWDFKTYRIMSYLGVREEVAKFALEMEAELKRESFADLDFVSLFCEFMKESGYMTASLEVVKHSKEPSNILRLIRCCAKTANILMRIAERGKKNDVAD